MIVIIDYDMGNVGSIANMITKIGGTSVISKDPSVIEKAAKLILPGVGAFDTGMENIRKFGLLEILNKKVLQDKIPLLGVCLGMQLLGRKSEEGTLPGLEWVAAESRRFPALLPNQDKLRIPHMGWNTTRQKKQDLLFTDMFQDCRFYFVHSYYVVCDKREDVLTETEYGITFTSSLSHGNIWGTQYHPEKSHKFGMKLYYNFVHKI